VSWTSDATCKTCPWWRSFKLESFQNRQKGQCRIVSPSRSGGWYQTDEDDWCGEHPDRTPEDKCEDCLPKYGAYQERAEAAEAELAALKAFMCGDCRSAWTARQDGES
jgi:hypothetical protein